jgi:AcrR family transcriptional regulator
MASARPAHLTPRKTPSQARATATLDAMFEATIQVLVADGRAGVSVGTMYQYFPHKQALFYALNERYLDVLASKVEAACLSQHGAAIEQMIEALVTTYWHVKTERPEVTRALYRSVVEIDNEALIAAFASRVDAATAAMLETASDATFSDLPTVNLTLLATVFGTVRNVFERNLSTNEEGAVRDQLMVMCNAYLKAARSPH